MFNPISLALDGLFPGLTTSLSVATSGEYDLEVIIQPVITGGGGYMPVSRGQKPDRYKITIVVRCNGKRFEESIMVDDVDARVRAKLNGITHFTEDEVMISINGVQVNKSNPLNPK